MSSPSPARFQILIDGSDDECEAVTPRESESWSPPQSDRGPITPRGLYEQDLDLARTRDPLLGLLQTYPYQATGVEDIQSIHHYRTSQDDTVASFMSGSNYSPDCSLSLERELDGNDSYKKSSAIMGSMQMVSLLSLDDAEYTDLDTDYMGTDRGHVGATKSPSDPLLSQVGSEFSTCATQDSCYDPLSLSVDDPDLANIVIGKSDTEAMEEAVQAITRSILQKIDSEEEPKKSEDTSTGLLPEEEFFSAMGDPGHLNQFYPIQPEQPQYYYPGHVDSHAAGPESEFSSAPVPMFQPYADLLYNSPCNFVLESQYQQQPVDDQQHQYVTEIEAATKDADEKQKEKDQELDLLAWLQKNLDTCAPVNSAYEPSTVTPRKHESVKSGEISFPDDPAIIQSGPIRGNWNEVAGSTMSGQSKLSLPIFSQTDLKEAVGDDTSGDEMLTMAQQMSEEIPTVYVSPNGLVTVLLKHEVAVEMTTDRSIRVVNHRHQSVAAANSRGNSSCIYHACAKIYQEKTTTDVEVFWDRRAKFTTSGVRFAHGPHCYYVDKESRLIPSSVNEESFVDQSKDMSTRLLCTDSSYGPEMTKECTEAAKNSNYVFHQDGSVSVFIMGIRICQLAGGDVVVTCGPKQIRVSPVYGSMYLRTHFVEMAVEMNWNIKVRRGDHRLHASFTGFLLTDGIQEFGFDQYRQPFLQAHTVQWETIVEEEFIKKAEELEAEDMASGENSAPKRPLSGMVPLATRRRDGPAREQRYRSRPPRSRVPVYRGAGRAVHNTRSLPLGGDAARLYDERRPPRRRPSRHVHALPSRRNSSREFYNSSFGTESRGGVHHTTSEQYARGNNLVA